MCDGVIIEIWDKLQRESVSGWTQIENYEETPMLRKLKNYIYNQYPLLSVASNYVNIARDMRRLYIKLTPYGFKFMGPKELQNGLYEPDETKLTNSFLF